MSSDIGMKQNSRAVFLSAKGLTKRFSGIEALSNVSFSLREREIHAVCGENGAGKSTLVKILTGVYSHDGGTIEIDGRPCDIRNPQDAQKLAIAFVAQELSLVPNLSVEDNIWLGTRGVPLFHKRRVLRERVRRALDQLGLHDVATDTVTGELGIGQRQLVEIARAFTRDARVVILDEPTATLSDVEIRQVFDGLRGLRDAGKAVVYITHRLGEVFEICDTVTVLRNGRLIGTTSTVQTDRRQLMSMMLGRDVGDLYPKIEPHVGGEMFSVRGLNIPRRVANLNLSARRGTVVGLVGQIGSGASAALRALAGLTPNATGQVAVNGVPYALRSVARSRAAKVQFISDDRAGEGIFLHMRVDQNLTATQLKRQSRFGVLRMRRLRAAALDLARRVGVDARRVRSMADELSGGNQQKLALGRVIGGANHGVLLMNDPTRGVDVGARAEIYRLIRDLCDSGFVILISGSDLEEMLGICDTVITMYKGRQVGQYSRQDLTMEQALSDITHPAGSA
jgi:ABC-type sugar transport system ATPase subunit